VVTICTIYLKFNELNCSLHRRCNIGFHISGSKDQVHNPEEYSLVDICNRAVVDHLCVLVVRVPGYRTEMYRASCEVRTEFIYVM
jgi:hypothetical protein